MHFIDVAIAADDAMWDKPGVVRARRFEVDKMAGSTPGKSLSCTPG